MSVTQVWFRKGFFTDKYIGVAERNGNRVLLNDTDTIAELSRKMGRL